MKFGRSVLGFGEGLIDRALCVIGTVAFAQFPEFVQQYLQRLGGHLDEARRQLAHFRDVATQSGLTLDGLISRTDANSDPVVAKLGGVMSEAVARVAHLEQAQAAIQNASPWTRPFAFLGHAEHDIVRATMHAFQPAVPTTVEGLVYAVLGMLVLLATYHLGVKYPVGRVLRARHARRAAQTA
jgi:hypothetical protein